MKTFKLIAGPCVVESYELLEEVARFVNPIIQEYRIIDFYFKSSFKKANRTSINSFESIGDDLAISYLKEIKNKYNFKICTDVHSNEDIEKVKDIADIIQIPAFLSRQTDLIKNSAKTGKIINIKKGQFLSPYEMEKAAKKAIDSGNNNVWLTERGTFFGYHDLVVDFRSLIIMKSFGFPVIYDATHSVQKPSYGEQSGGSPEFILPLMKASLAIGVDGLFLEVHPEPQKALSDSASQLQLNKFDEVIELIKKFLNL